MKDMRDGMSVIDDKLASFRKKYYLNLLLRGVLLSLTLFLVYLLLASVLEYTLWLSSWARLTIVILFVGLVLFSFFRFLREPARWWLYKKGLGKEESARMIGAFYPSVSDRLLNLLQLSVQSGHNELTDAGILQKSRQFDNVSFEQAINLRGNLRYARYLLIPLGIILIILVINRGIITQSTSRIIQFNREFSPTAPFRFEIGKGGLAAFFNEDFTLSVQLIGNQIPDAAYLVSDNKRIKLEKDQAGDFSYTFEKLQHEVHFQLEASGYFSEPFSIAILNRPELNGIKIQLEYPRYLGRNGEQVSNSGNLEVPEGTVVTWQINTSNASKATIQWASKAGPIEMQLIDDQSFKLSKGFKNPDQYKIDLQNENSHNKEALSYSILVVKDQFPQLEIDHVRDSILYKTVFLGGTVRDDYGLTALLIHYELLRDGNLKKGSLNIPIAQGARQQSFFYEWRLDSLTLKPGDRLDYFLQLWDNDGVNGRKSVRSSSFAFALPSEQELKELIATSQQETESQVQKSVARAKDVRQSMDEALQKLKGKQVMDWQDKKMLDNMLEQKKSLDEMISNLQKQNELLEKKKETFSKQNEKIREKAEQIQKLMDELLDPETKKLFEELQKLLKDNSDMNQVQKMLEKMNRKEMNLEKELERTLELFKQLQLDYKVEQLAQDLGELSHEQENLLTKTEQRISEQKEKSNQSDTSPQNENKSDQDKKESKGGEGDVDPPKEDLAQQQKALKEKFERSEKKMDEVEKLSKELGNHTSPPDQGDRNDVKDDMEKSEESLDSGQPAKSAPSQKQAISKLNQMKQKMERMQSGMQEEIDLENLESLRQIVHGMIKLSFDQEGIMKEFGLVQQTDPRYIQLSQLQLKIKDDSKVLEDSLLSLAKKDPKLGSFVTREVGNLDSHLEKAAEHIRERRKPGASSEMQLSMTSINNLAIMLNDHFEKMMEMMANAKPSPGKGKGKSKSKSLSEMQVELNQKIQELQRGNKSGKQFSEELAKAAAEQERIRRALQEMEEKLKQDGGKIPGGDILGKMEETEMDLVNKHITEKTLLRQREIEVRLLEAEKSMREQNQDEERKGETAKEYSKEIPKAFEEYLRLKEKEVELLKTVPPKLYPYYKKEVTEYFKRIGNP